MKLYCLLLEIFVVSLILSLLQTPVADWLATGLNLCNSGPFNPLLRPYASASGPLFGAPASVQARGFDLLSALTPEPGFPVNSRSGPRLASALRRGGPPPRNPSLEERLDDHQPT